MVVDDAVLVKPSAPESGSARTRRVKLPWRWGSDAWDAPDKLLRARREFEQRLQATGGEKKRSRKGSHAPST